MEDSFKTRVERLFGSRLFSSVPKSSFPEASWSVSDGNVERRLWNRERGVDSARDETPCSSAFDDLQAPCFDSKHRKLQDNLDEDEGCKAEEPDEESEIRASVGLDPTLDREDEEDEYDRVAVGNENKLDRVYMRDINCRGPFISYQSVIDFFEDSTEEFHEFHPDPRADHHAAEVRLKEDKGGANSAVHHVPSVDYGVLEVKGKANLKSILKRKEDQIDSRPKKKVRFSPAQDTSTIGSKVIEEISEDGITASVSAHNSSIPSEDSPGIPDYIRNPSKYICYSFDTTNENDEELNRQGFEDFRNIISKSNSQNSDIEYPTDLPKSLVFTPRKKLMDAMTTDQEPGSSSVGSCKGIIRGIAAGETGDSDPCAMDEDASSAVPEENTAAPKNGRKYRSKTSSIILEFH